MLGRAQVRAICATSAATLAALRFGVRCEPAAMSQAAEDEKADGRQVESLFSRTRSAALILPSHHRFT